MAFCKNMKKLFSLILTLALTSNVFGVGCIVEKDIKKLSKRGFTFSTVDYRATSKTIAFSVVAPNKYDFSDIEMGIKPFEAIYYVKPEDRSVTGSKLIAAAGTSLLLAHNDLKKGKGCSFTMIRAEATGGYLRFAYNQGSGHPPMWIYVPIKSIADHLKSSAQNN